MKLPEPDDVFEVAFRIFVIAVMVWVVGGFIKYVITSLFFR